MIPPNKGMRERGEGAKGDWAVVKDKRGRDLFLHLRAEAVSDKQERVSEEQTLKSWFYNKKINMKIDTENDLNLQQEHRSFVVSCGSPPRRKSIQNRVSRPPCRNAIDAGWIHPIWQISHLIRWSFVHPELISHRCPHP